MLEKRLGISPALLPAVIPKPSASWNLLFSQSQTTKFETLGCSINPDLLQWPAISKFPERRQRKVLLCRCYSTSLLTHALQTTRGDGKNQVERKEKKRFTTVKWRIKKKAKFLSLFFFVCFLTIMFKMRGGVCGGIQKIKNFKWP